MPIFGARLIELDMTTDPTGALSGTVLSNSGGDFLGTVDADFDTEVVGNTNRMNIGDLVDLDGDGTFEGTYEGRFRFGGTEYTLGDGSTFTTSAHIVEISVGGTSRYFLLIRDANATDIDADNLQSVELGNNFSTRNNTNIGNFDDADTYILVCFAEGTLIRTPHGEVPVELLVAGDLVWTRDAGMQPIRWVGSRCVRGTGPNAPIAFAAGAIGNTRPLRLSPQHRVLLSGAWAELYFGETEVLAAAKQLVNGDTIYRAPCEEVRYHHFSFDRHQLVESNGCLTESFYPSARNIAGQDAQARAELMDLFPGLGAGEDFGETARPVLRGYEALALAGACMAA